jgi:hypothetical protein
VIATDTHKPIRFETPLARISTVHDFAAVATTNGPRNPAGTLLLPLVPTLAVFDESRGTILESLWCTSFVRPNFATVYRLDDKAFRIEAFCTHVIAGTVEVVTLR